MHGIDKYLLTTVLVGLAASPAGAQRRDPAAAKHPGFVTAATEGPAWRAARNERLRADFIDGRTLSADARRLRPDRWGAAGTTVLTSGDEQTTYLLVRRAMASRPEVHARWDDIVIVRSGTGAVEMGDSLVGSTYRAPGERVGGRFTRSYRIVVHAGDIVRIPAAVPHAFVVSGAEPLEYLVIKQRRQEKPIRWARAR